MKPLPSPSLLSTHLAQLRTLFPQAFTEKGVDFQVLRELLGDAVDAAEERFGLNWHGKAAARRLALSPSRGTLRPMRAQSVDWDSTQNLILEGENLEVLKLLQKSYGGRVDFLYIDPPYNTGNDFIYPDDYRDSITNYLRMTGQVDAEGRRVSSAAEVQGRTHTAWLNLMYPRLMLARHLMSPRGVGFISLDGHELAHCKLLLNEIFGEENHLAILTWVSNLKGRQIGGGGPVGTHEYILCFARDARNVQQFRGNQRALHRLMPSVYKSRGYEIKHDAIGAYVTKNQLYNTNSKFNEKTAPTLVYRIHHNFQTGETRVSDIDSQEELPGFTTILPHPNARPDVRWHAWRWSRKRVLEQGQDLDFRMVKGKPRIYTKVRDVDGTALKDLILGPSTLTGQEDLKKLGLERAFDNPKPVALLQTLLQASAPPDALVLDFFAGSGATAEATLRANHEDGGSRRFILVQLPESVQGGPFKTITEITRERTRRVIHALHEASPSPQPPSCPGFRSYRLDSSNLRPWDPAPADLDHALLAHTEPLQPGRTEEDLLSELLLHLGIDLCAPIQTRTLAGLTVYLVGDGPLLACFAGPIDRAQVEPLALGIIEWQDAQHLAEARARITTAVFRDAAFADDVAKRNLVHTLSQAGLQIRSL